MQKKAFLQLLILALVPFIMVLGNSMLIPVLPQAQKSMGISRLQVGLLITLFSLPAGLTIPLAGFLADRLGRKKVLIPALILYGAGGLIAGLAASLIKKPYLLVLAGRIVQGAGAAGTAPVAMALVGDIFTSNERSKALGMLESANGLGKVVSPIAGALAGLISWYLSFYIFPALTLPVAAAIAFFVLEPGKNNNNQKNLPSYWATLKSIWQQKGMALATAFAAGAASLLVLFGLLFLLSDRLEETFAVNGLRKGFYIALPVLVMAVTSYISGYILQKKIQLTKGAVICGLLLAAAGIGALYFFDRRLLPSLLTASLTGMGTGITLPALNTLVTSSVAPQERGMISALYGGVRFLGVAAGPPLFARLMEAGQAAPSLGGGLMLLTAALLVLFFLKRHILLTPSPSPA